MNPGRRRLLIPALLVVLLAIVAIVGIARVENARTKLPQAVPSAWVSSMDDPRITESSGLAVSFAHPGIAYTFNDSGHAPQLFAIQIDTGKVVGVTTAIGNTWKDAEAMSLVGGKVWIGDTGTDWRSGADHALYVFPEPGPGNHRIRPDRYPLTFAGKQQEVEAMGVFPGRVEFYAKGWSAGRAYVLTGPLRKDRPNVAHPESRALPVLTADAATSPDGRLVLLRGILTVEVRDAATWRLRHTDVIPVLRRGESIAMEASGRSYLIGTEGKDSPLLRIAFDRSRVDAKPDPYYSAAEIRARYPIRATFWQHPQAFVAGGGILLACAAFGLLDWRRLRRRRKESTDGS